MALLGANLPPTVVISTQLLDTGTSYLPSKKVLLLVVSLYVLIISGPLFIPRTPLFC